MDNIQNIQNLDSIIFYSGDTAQTAAELVEARAFGEEVEGLGTLSKDNTGAIYYSNYPRVKYKERNISFDNMNDLYSETLSYITVSHDSELLGNTYISNNRYNAIYTYETDLNNDFGTARQIVKDNLEEFLIGLNNQKYNKQAKYGNNNEISSIKIDQTYFTWYPENTIAYYNTEYTHTAYTYTYYFINSVSMNVYDGEENETLTAYIQEYLAATGKDELDELDFIHSYSYSGEIVTSEDIPYIIGGNYYSYIRQEYDTIDYKLAEKIDDKLSDFETRYNNDPSIYAYYMYDCNSDIKMMLTSLSLGVKESTFKIGFDSKYNKWFDNIINIKAEVVTNDAIAKITSAEDDAIFAVFKNNTDRLTGDNVELDKDEYSIFAATSDTTLEDTINILTPYRIDTLDLSPIKTKISNVLDLTETGWMESGLHMKSLILDDGDDTTKSNIEKIFGLNELTSLEYVDMSNIDKLSRTPAIDKLENLKVFKAKGSNIDSFRPMKGATLYDVELPGTIKSLKLVNNVFSNGTLKVGGEDIEFEGTFNYTPNDTLTSLTLRNIDDKLSYKLVSDWYTAIETANKLDSLIYLELIGLDWNNIPIQKLVDIKHFDINPNISGEISVIGSGNYKHITRNEYQNIVKLYGINAFVAGNNINDKVFKNLDIKLNKEKELFEFDLKILNKSAQAYNELISDDDRNAIKYEDTLNVSFNGYQYDNNFGTERVVSPYLNRAANALLDIIYKNNQDFTFIKDDVDDYAYCKLENSIDTAASDEVRNIKAGDILLFNGDTLVIFFKDTTNSMYEYIKLGHITDVDSYDYYRRRYSTIEHWFDYNNAATLRFIPSVRPVVVDNIDATVSADEFTSESAQTLTLTVSLSEAVTTAIANNEVEDPAIVVEAPEFMTIVDNENGTYTITIDYDYSADAEAEIKIYAHANREETEVIKTITLVTNEVVEPEEPIVEPEEPTIEPTVIDENNEGQITIDDSALEYNEEDNELIIEDTLNPEFDESTHTLTID